MIVGEMTQDGLRVAKDNAVIVKNGNLTKRIYREKLGSLVLSAGIEIDRDPDVGNVEERQ